MKFLDENVQAWEFTTLYLIARKFHFVFCAFDTSIVILSKCILLNTLTLVKKKVKKSTTTKNSSFPINYNVFKFLSFQKISRSKKKHPEKLVWYLNV